MGVWGDWSARFWKVADCVLPSRLSQALPAGTPQGAHAERLAEQHLIARGARILDRNARSKGGEVDLIALHEGCVLFVEVRLRRNSNFGGAAASITPAKQRRIVLAANHWLQGAGRRYQHHPCRFDAVLLDAVDDTRVEWLQAVFSETGA